MRERVWLVAAAAGFVAFAAYGSLVPFDLRVVPLDEAVEQFRSIRYIPLAHASRTDVLTNSC